MKKRAIQISILTAILTLIAFLWLDKPDPKSVSRTESTLGTRLSIFFQRREVDTEVNAEQAAKTILNRVRNTKQEKFLRIDVSEDYAIEVSYIEYNNTWEPVNLLVKTLPVRSDYPSKAKFLRATCWYFASKWLIENTKQYPFEQYSDVGIPVLQDDGKWHVESGRARISGSGLYIVIDSNGSLLKIEEIFNPE